MAANLVPQRVLDRMLDHYATAEQSPPSTNGYTLHGRERLLSLLIPRAVLCRDVSLYLSGSMWLPSPGHKRHHRAAIRCAPWADIADLRCVTMHAAIAVRSDDHVAALCHYRGRWSVPALFSTYDPRCGFFGDTYADTIGAALSPSVAVKKESSLTGAHRSSCYEVRRLLETETMTTLHLSLPYLASDRLAVRLVSVPTLRHLVLSELAPCPAVVMPALESITVHSVAEMCDAWSRPWTVATAEHRDRSDGTSFSSCRHGAAAGNESGMDMDAALFPALESLTLRTKVPPAALRTGAYRCRTLRHLTLHTKGDCIDGVMLVGISALHRLESLSLLGAPVVFAALTQRELSLLRSLRSLTVAGLLACALGDEGLDTIGGTNQGEPGVHIDHFNDEGRDEAGELRPRTPLDFLPLLPLLSALKLGDLDGSPSPDMFRAIGRCEGIRSLTIPDALCPMAASILGAA